MERHGAYRHIVAYRSRDRGKSKTEKTHDLLKRCALLREFHILHNMLTENIAYFSENVGSEPERCRKAAPFRPYAKAFAASCNTQLQVDWCGWLDGVNWFAQTKNSLAIAAMLFSSLPNQDLPCVSSSNFVSQGTNSKASSGSTGYRMHYRMHPHPWCPSKMLERSTSIRQHDSAIVHFGPRTQGLR